MLRAKVVEKRQVRVRYRLDLVGQRVPKCDLGQTSSAYLHAWELLRNAESGQLQSPAVSGCSDAHCGGLSTVGTLAFTLSKTKCLWGILNTGKMWLS